MAPPTIPIKKMKHAMNGIFQKSLLVIISPKDLHMQRFWPVKVAVDQTSKTMGAFNHLLNVIVLGEISIRNSFGI